MPGPHYRVCGNHCGKQSARHCSWTDGALWFAEFAGNKIGRITTQGTFTEFPIPTANSGPAYIALGSDRALWFTEFNTDKIGRMTTQGATTEFNLPSGSNPQGIALGNDGALWFVESTGNKIGRITTQGAITEFAVPTALSGLYGITPGPDGALWFTEEEANKVGRITLQGSITEFAANGGPEGITAGLDGALWYTEFTGVKVGRLTTAGSTTEYPVANPGFLQGIAIGPHGAIWFAEYSTTRLGQILNQTASLSASTPQGVPGSPETITGSGFGPNESVSITDGSGPFHTVTTDSSGAFSLTADLRPAPFGTNTFVATGQTSRRVGIATYSIIPISLANPTVTTAGSQVTITGFGFLVDDSVGMFIDNRFQVGTAVTDSHGSISGANAVVFTVSPRLPKGPHTVVALGTNGTGATAHFTIQ